jgi:DNA-binding NarL/FixJ family response regulator
MTERPDSSRDRPAHILIVDDEPLNVDYLEQELGSLGFFTERAANGVEALERVKANPPDLVLLDVMMPRMDGISTLRVLKRDPETRLIPVVLMTALNAVEDRVRGIEAGADDFLSKPVDERELLARIRTALDLRRAIDETVGELRSASDQLERYGRQQRDVAVLAIDWQVRERGLPEDAVGFVARRDREAAARRIRAHGGLPTDDEVGPLIAVFDGPDTLRRATAAIEAAQAVLGEPTSDQETGALGVGAVVTVGRAEVGSARVRRAGEERWAYTAGGKPVERATRMARAPGRGSVLLDGDAAAAVSERFALEPEAGGGYRVLERTDGDETAGVSAAHVRQVRTLLITDIVGSTKTAERIGDSAWTKLIGVHDRVTREQLVLFGGEELDTTGDGFVAAFDAPARAIRCAVALVDRVAAVGLTIRAGVHTAEVEYVEGKPRGIALNIATRIAARADSGEVLVSDTTRELAAGSGLAFADRGDYILRGVSGQKRLYAAVDERTQAGAMAPRTKSTPTPDVGGVEYPAGLTGREVEVLRLVAAGLTDAEVAERLVLSVRTVNAHLRSIYRKTGVPSRAAASRFAAEHDLL